MAGKKKKKPQVPKKRLSVQERRFNRVAWKLLAWVCFMLFLVIAFFYTIHRPELRIQNMTIEGIETLDSQELQRAVVSHLLESTQIAIPSDSIFFYNKESIESLLRTLYPAIENIKVSTIDLTTIGIAVDERVLNYHVQLGQDIYDIDANATAFRVSTDEIETERVFSHFEFTSSDSELLLPKKIFDVSWYIQINAFADKLGNMGIPIRYIRIDDELTVILQDERGVRIIVDYNGDYDIAYETLREILPYRDFSYDRDSDSFTKPVEYINMRYGDRIFYCYTGDECEDNYLISYD